MLIVICGSWLLNVLLYSMKGNADEWWEKLGSTVPCLLFFLVVIIIKKVLPVALVFSKNCQISANALEVCVHESYWCRRWWQKILVKNHKWASPCNSNNPPYFLEFYNYGSPDVLTILLQNITNQLFPSVQQICEKKINMTGYDKMLKQPISVPWITNENMITWNSTVFDIKSNFDGNI